MVVFQIELFPFWDCCQCRFRAALGLTVRHRDLEWARHRCSCSPEMWRRHCSKYHRRTRRTGQPFHCFPKTWILALVEFDASEHLSIVMFALPATTALCFADEFRARMQALPVP